MAFKHDLQLGAKIGSGFFGDVHEGDDRVHGKVAVKVLRPFSGESAASWAARKDSLLAEAQNLKAAEHENTVQVYTLVRADVDDLLHMVVEFCSGGSLQNEYERGPMLLTRVRAVIMDVCRGLEFIHGRGMLHRDIKPANILCSNGRLKIGDFGLVTNALVAGYARAAGYSDHLAPEVHNFGLTSAKTDVWALGMTIYRLLNGHEFYQRHFAAVDIPTSILNGDFALRLPWLPHVPKAWRMFVRRAMHDDTARRFGSAFDMAQAAARLPTTPDWTCLYTPTRIVWTRTKNGRQQNVVFESLSARKNRWVAMSRGGTRDKRIAGDNLPTSMRQAFQGLEAFFAAST